MRRRRGLLGWAAVVVASVLAVLLAVSAWLTLVPRIDAPARVDVLLVLYSDGEVYHEARRLAEQGVSDTLLVSDPPLAQDRDLLCGPQARHDPALQGVEVICFSPDPVTTQGEVMAARDLIDARGLEHLGILSFRQQATRARVLAERCLDEGRHEISLYAYHRDDDPLMALRTTVYGMLAWAKVAVTPGCETQLPDWIEAPLDGYKEWRHSMMREAP